MADLSAIPKENIEALENALGSIGLNVGDIDGVADDALRVGVIKGLETINRLFGNGGDVAGYDAAQVAELTQTIKDFVEGDGNGLSRFEQLNALANKDYAALGIDGNGLLATRVRNTIERAFDGKTPAEAMPEVLDYIGKIPGYGHVKDLVEKIPVNVMADIPAALEFIENSETYLGVMDALNDANFFAEEVAPEILAEADPEVQQQSDIQRVEAAIGIETPDGVWGAGERAALKATIAAMQQGDITWLGRKDGVYTDEYADYVLGRLDDARVSGLREDELHVYSPAQQALFNDLEILKEQNVKLLIEGDAPRAAEDIAADITSIDTALPLLLPILQQEIDDQRLKAQRLIESIQGGKASAAEIQAATAVMARTNKPEEELTEKELQDREEAQHYLNRTGLADNIGDFIDGFLLLGQSDLGNRMIAAGKRWSVDSIEARLANLKDLPDADTLNPLDGRIDTHEQETLQHVLYLMGEKFGVPANDRLPHTPEMSDRYLKGFQGLPLEEREAFITGIMSEADLAEYNAQDPEGKEAYVDGLFKGALDNVDRLMDDGVLSADRLYSREGYVIGDVTIDIFDEFMQGDAEQDIAPASMGELKMLNAMTHAFTGGMDLVGILGEDYEFPEGFDPKGDDAIGLDDDPEKSLTARFKEAYEEGGAERIAHMMLMMETLPYGNEEWREEINTVAKAALDAAERERESGASDAMVALLFASEMQSGIAGMESDPSMHSEYLLIEQRPITMDPRSADFTMQVNGETVTANDIHTLHEEQNQGFDPAEVPVYQPLMFTGEDGKVYIGAIDYESRIFSIQEVDFEAWERVVAENPRKPGESRNEHNKMLDEKLGEEVSGYNLLFQHKHEGDRQVTLIKGVNFKKFPELMEGKIKSYAAEKASVDADKAVRAQEEFDRKVDDATPGTHLDVFNDKANDNSEPSYFGFGRKDIGISPEHGSVGGINAWAPTFGSSVK